MYPAITPFKSGLLEVEDGNHIYWELSGNPTGVPALFIHGGPGGGIKNGYRRRFDPEKYLIISYEQRGCGRSTPLAYEVISTLENNSTQNLIGDIEYLRKFLNIDRLLINGISWGTYLALTYAQKYPQNVLGLVLTCVSFPTSLDVKWITEDLQKIFPIEYELFKNAVLEFDGDTVIEKYYSAITNQDIKKRKNAAVSWCRWEDAHVSLDPKLGKNPDFDIESFRINFATLVIHYWKNNGFFNENIFENLDKLINIPIVVIQGKLDISSPMENVFKLKQSLPQCEIIIVPDEGHGGEKIINLTTQAISQIYSKLNF